MTACVWVALGGVPRDPSATRERGEGKAATPGLLCCSVLPGRDGFALLGASLVQPLFRGAELEGQKRQAEAALDQAGAAYREVVLSALQDVADILVSLDADAKTLRERAEAARLARSAWEITAREYEAGGVSLLALLDTERRHLAATVEETRAIGERYADSAALFQALGGGWWTTEPPPPPAAQPPER